MWHTYLPVKAAETFAMGLTNSQIIGWIFCRELVENCVRRVWITFRGSFFGNGVQPNFLHGCNTGESVVLKNRPTSDIRYRKLQ